jgi:hypothetical protein
VTPFGDRCSDVIVDGAVVVVHQEECRIGKVLEVASTLNRLGSSTPVDHNDADRRGQWFVAAKALLIPITEQAAEKARLGSALPHDHSAAQQRRRCRAERSLHVVQVAWHGETAGDALIGSHDRKILSGERLDRDGRVSREDDLELMLLCPLLQVAEGVRQPMGFEAMLDLIDRDDRAASHRLILNGQAGEATCAEPKTREGHVAVVKNQRVSRGSRPGLQAGPGRNFVNGAVPSFSADDCAVSAALCS